MRIKTVYKKAIIIGSAALVLEALLIYFIYTSINAFYADLTNKIAFMLVEQVKEVIAGDNLKLSQLSQYNKYPTRRLMNRVSGEDSKIIHILLIDTTNNIVVSDDPSVEGKTYTSPQELSLLKTDQPTVINRKWEGDQEILDVIVPLLQDSVKQGYLRAVISVKHLENFYTSRRNILIFSSFVTMAIIILTVFFTSRIYKGNIENIQEALDKLHEADYQYRLNYQKKDEFAPLFERLNELFEKTFDLNASYRQSEERINAMMEVIHEGLMIVDVNMKIVSHNEYLLDIFHIRRSKNAEDQIYRILVNNPKLVEIYRRTRDPMTHSVRKELSVRLLDGETVNIQVNSLSILEGENTNSVVFYIKNLELLKELEQNLSRSMKYTVISQLARSIGHEIRNPLSSLAIHTEVLDNLTDKIDGQQENEEKSKIKKSINILNSEIARISKLIDSFFNLARPKEIELRYENINKVSREVIELVQQESFEKKVNLRIHLGKKIPLVNISHDQLKQVILNLVLNAFDAMPEGGDLYIITREHENNVVIMIRDTGKGIPEEIREDVFNYYFSTKESGGGIGLAVSKKIIEAHEGRIYFKTEIGKGTTFVIELPRASNV